MSYHVIELVISLLVHLYDIPRNPFFLCVSVTNSSISILFLVIALSLADVPKWTGRAGINMKKAKCRRSDHRKQDKIKSRFVELLSPVCTVITTNPKLNNWLYTQQNQIYKSSLYPRYLNNLVYITTESCYPLFSLLYISFIFTVLMALYNNLGTPSICEIRIIWALKFS